MSLNIGSFLLLDVSKKFNVNKKKLLVGFAVLVCGVISFLLFDSQERAVMSFYISVCLFGSLGLKFLMFKLFPPKETQIRGVRIVRKIIDSYFMPIFVFTDECFAVYVSAFVGLMIRGRCERC